MWRGTNILRFNKRSLYYMLHNVPAPSENTTWYKRSKKGLENTSPDAKNSEIEGSKRKEGGLDVVRVEVNRCGVVLL